MKKQETIDTAETPNFAEEGPKNHLKAGNLHRKEGRLNEAIKQFTKAIHHDPTSTAALLVRADVYEQMAEYPKAISDLERVIKLDPNCTDAYKTLSFLYGKTSMEEEIPRNYLMKAKAREQYHPGITYKEEGKLNEAIKQFTKAVTYDPAYAYALAYRAHTYVALGDRENAIKDCISIINLYPEEKLHPQEAGNDINQRIYINRRRAISLIDQNRLDEAIEHFTTAIAIGSNHGWAHHGLAVIYALQGDKTKATEHLDTALKSPPTQDMNELRGGTNRLRGGSVSMRYMQPSQRAPLTTCNLL